MAVVKNRTAQRPAEGYTAKQLADMAGVSVRTLHYYEELGLLHPARDANNWRRYGARDVTALRVVLGLRACGLSTEVIGALMAEEEPDMLKVLSFHREHLLDERQRVDTLLATTDTLLDTWKDMKNMTDEESFAALKRHCIDRFEEKYGEEARERYGDTAIDESNARMAAMTREEWDSKEALEQAIKERLRTLLPTGEPASPEAAELAALHAQWIRMHWGEAGYSPEAHVALAQGYLADPRFVDYYDSACGKGATEFLAAAIEHALG